MKTPLALKWIIALAYIQIAFAFLFFCGIIAAAAFPAESGFMRGYEEGVAKSFGASSLDQFGAEKVGEATAKATISMVLPFVVLVCAHRRARVGLIVTLVIGICMTFGQKGLPLFTIVQLILSLRGSIARYMNQSPGEPDQALEPTPMAVTDPAAQAPRQP
ncbi:hypothetical protein DB347_25355 [Opitutaceae bacterium EW11]|nr:hypothetical protein DB347_25355 [Opitutaceae bacterium EW11]